MKITERRLVEQQWYEPVLKFSWDNKKGVYILDSEHMNVHTIL